jgi:hypothetical protein
MNHIFPPNVKIHREFDQKVFLLIHNKKNANKHFHSLKKLIKLI